MQIKVSEKPVPYNAAHEFMEERVNAIIAGEADELIWFLEHEPVYTAGTSAKDEDLLDGKKFPVVRTGRGGEFTYHGPGQLVCYLMLDLKKREMMDLKKYVHTLEEVVIKTLAELKIFGERRERRIGIWVMNNKTEEKVAAIGIRVRKWVAYHGFALNVNPDLSHFAGIVPCGIKEYGVTSLAKLGIKKSMPEIIQIVNVKIATIIS